MCALRAADTAQASAIMALIGRDSWVQRPAYPCVSEISAHFHYLPRIEGRKPQPKQHACEATLGSEDGRFRFGGKGRCEAAAQYSARKLNAYQQRECITERQQYTTKILKHTPVRWPYPRRHVTAPFQEIRLCEIRKVIEKCGPGNAPGKG